MTVQRRTGLANKIGFFKSLKSRIDCKSSASRMEECTFTLRRAALIQRQNNILLKVEYFQIKILQENVSPLCCKAAKPVVRGEMTVYLMLHLGRKSREDSK